jgi:hypothetical protein
MICMKMSSIPILINGTLQHHLPSSLIPLPQQILTSISSLQNTGLTEKSSNKKLTWQTAIQLAKSIQLGERIHQFRNNSSLASGSCCNSTITTTTTTTLNSKFRELLCVVIRLESSFTAIIATLAVLLDDRLTLVPLAWDTSVHETERILVECQAYAYISTARGLWEAEYVLHMINGLGLVLDDDSMPGIRLPSCCVEINTRSTNMKLPINNNVNVTMNCLDEPCLIAYDSTIKNNNDAGVGIMFSHRAIMSWSLQLYEKYQTTYINRPKGEVYNAEMCMGLIFPCLVNGGLDAHFSPRFGGGNDVGGGGNTSSKNIIVPPLSRAIGPSVTTMMSHLSKQHSFNIITSLVIWAYQGSSTSIGNNNSLHLITCGLIDTTVSSTTANHKIIPIQQINNLEQNLPPPMTGKLCISGASLPMCIFNHVSLNTESFILDDNGELWFVTPDIVQVEWLVVTTSTTSNTLLLPHIEFRVQTKNGSTSKTGGSNFTNMVRNPIRRPVSHLHTPKNAHHTEEQQHSRPNIEKTNSVVTPTALPSSSPLPVLNSPVVLVGVKSNKPNLPVVVGDNSSSKTMKASDSMKIEIRPRRQQQRRRPGEDVNQSKATTTTTTTSNKNGESRL